MSEEPNPPNIEEDNKQKPPTDEGKLLDEAKRYPKSFRRALSIIIDYGRKLITGILTLIVPPTVLAFLLCFILWILTKPVLYRWYWQPPSQWWKQWETLIFIFVMLPIILHLFWRIPKWQLSGLVKKIDHNDYRSLEPNQRVQLEKDLVKFESDSRLALAQILGGAFLLVGLYFTAENLRVNQESATANAINAEANIKIAQDRLVSEKFTQAVQQLGKLDLPNENNLALRLGAIQTLEQLAWLPTIQRLGPARDEGPVIYVTTTTGKAAGVLTYHEPVMRILAAYFRTNASVSAYKKANERAMKAGEGFSWPTSDLGAILKVLGRRQLTYEPRTSLKQRLDLSYTVIGSAALFGANFEGADLRGVDLTGAGLEQARFKEALLEGAKFKEALLEGAKFDGAQLQGADFTGAEGVDWDYVKSVAKIDENTIPPTGKAQRQGP
jgi:Pentapeptide repeats (8 copies)